MLQGRSLPSLVAMYFVVIGTLLACAGISLAVVVKTAAGSGDAKLEPEGRRTKLL